MKIAYLEGGNYMKCPRCHSHKTEAEICWFCKNEFEQEIVDKINQYLKKELEESKKRCGIESYVDVDIKFNYEKRPDAFEPY
jgi:hypothetical protein